MKNGGPTANSYEVHYPPSWDRDRFTKDQVEMMVKVLSDCSGCNKGFGLGALQNDPMLRKLGEVVLSSRQKDGSYIVKGVDIPNSNTGFSFGEMSVISRKAPAMSIAIPDDTILGRLDEQSFKHILMRKMVRQHHSFWKLVDKCIATAFLPD
eukprot:gene1941-1986_t